MFCGEQEGTWCWCLIAQLWSTENAPPRELQNQNGLIQNNQKTGSTCVGRTQKQRRNCRFIFSLENLSFSLINVENEKAYSGTKTLIDVSLNEITLKLTIILTKESY